MRRLTLLFLLPLLWIGPAAAQQTIVSSLDVLGPEEVPTRTPADVRGAKGRVEPRDPVERLVRQYRKTGRAEVLRQSNDIVYPFGHSQPILKCAPLRACLVELAPGETVMSIIAGDSQRWLVDEAYTGPSGTTPLVVVKPTADGITTNLIVSTDRHVYHLTLDSVPAKGEGTNPQASYMRQVSFYYPDEMVKQITAREDQTDQVRRRQANEVSVAAGASLEDLNFGFDWKRDDDFPWKPKEIFDDGRHVYIKLPGGAAAAEAPLLFGVSASGEKTIINYAIRGGFYITDRVFKKAAFVIGVDKRSGFLGLGGKKRTEQRLEIINLDR